MNKEPTIWDRFDWLINSLPERVGETPREVIKDFFEKEIEEAIKCSAENISKTDSHYDMKKDKEFFDKLAEVLEREFIKGEKCSCGRKLPCRSKAIVLNAFANLFFRELKNE